MLKMTKLKHTILQIEFGQDGARWMDGNYLIQHCELYFSYRCTQQFNSIFLK